MANIDKGVRTIAGEVGTTRMISAPHTRTNKDGRFYIPPRLFFSIPTPFSFGMTAERLIIMVRVADGRRAQIDLTKNLWKLWFSTKIPATVKEMKDEDRLRELQDLYRYCAEGTFLLVVPKIPGGCDKWELDYTIVELEKFINENQKPINAEHKDVLCNLSS